MQFKSSFVPQLVTTVWLGLGALIFTSVVLPNGVEADRFSGLCPPSYPRQVSFNGTGRCYQVGTHGPCPKLMVVASNPKNPNFGTCRCKSLGSSCFGRPLVEWEDRCYFEFSQGPCHKGQWLVSGKHGHPTCQKSPCPLVENQRSLLRAEIPRKNFYFTVSNSYDCFMTGTQAFCEDGLKAYFVGSERFPRCLNYDPWDCYHYTPAEQTVTLRQGDPKPAPGFGGPCHKGQWLVSGKHGHPTCQKSPCPLVENQRSLLRAEIPRKNFYFTVSNSYDCFMTGTQAFCEDGFKAYFVGSERFPRCLNYDPWDCDHYTPAEQTVTLRQGDPKPAPGFGVPYDGI